MHIDANLGAGHANHTRGNRAEFVQDPLSFPSGTITRLRAKPFKEAINGLIQENGADSKKTKMGYLLLSQKHDNHMQNS
jgi:hypothetical protein